MTDRRLAPLHRPSHPHPPSRAADVARPARPAGAGAPSAGPSRVVDNAVYSDGRRVATPASPAREPRGAGRGRGPPGVAGPLPAGAAGARCAGRAVRPARARRRGRDQGPPAAEVRAVRRHAVRRPQGRPVPGRRSRRSSSASCTCSSAPDFVDHRPAQRVARPLAGAAPAGERAGAAGQGQRGGALRDPGRRRRRVLAGGRRAGERHRRDRDRGLPRRPAASRGASTSCPRRCWSSSAPRSR